MVAPLGSPDRAPILRGRAGELAVIGEHIAATRGGGSGILLIEGRAGHGKTRMLAEAAAMASRSGLRAGYGANLPGDQMIQMGALLAALFGDPDPLFDRSALRDLRALPEERYWLLDQLESLLERAALDAPLLLSLDDMHWADGGCRAAIRTLPAHLMGLPIVWMFAFRGDQLSPELREAYDDLEQLGAQRLIIGPLGEPAVAEVVDDLLGGKPDEPLLELVEGARGSPFLLVELIRGLLEDGLIRSASGQAELIEVRLPARVRDGMRDRLLRMSQGARRAAQVASILGGSFSFGWLAAMLDMAPSMLLGPVDELRQAELLTEVEGQLTFRHDLLREAVVDTLPGSTRRALQRQAADVLMARGAPPLEVAALLAAGAEPGDDVAVAAMLRAVRELAFHDPGAAADLGRRALELAAADDPNRGPLTAETALLLYAADRTAEGQAFADAALGSELPAEQQAEIRLSIAQMYTLSADVRAANGRAALALADVSEPLRARHLAWLSHNLLGAGRVADARPVIREAQSAVAGTGDDRAVFRMAVVGATLDFVDGRYAPALEQLERAGQLPAPRITREFDPGLEVTRSEVLAATDRLDDALRVTVDGLASAQRDRLAYAIRAWEQYRGRRLLELGRLTDAAAALAGTLGVDSLRPAVYGADAPAVVALGRVALHTRDDRLAQVCRRMAETMLDTSPPEVRRHAAWLLMLQAMAGSDETAVRETVEALGEDARISVLPQVRFDPTDAPQLVRIALAIADERLADQAVSAAEDRHRLNRDVRSLAATAAHARGLRSADVDELAAAVELFRAAPRPLAYASALEDLGRGQVSSGRRAEGIASLGEALEVYTHCGAAWDAGRVRGRLRTLGIRRRVAVRVRPARGWAGLTESELRVAELVSQGLTNRDVATRMFLSPHTVSMHLRHAFAKMDINSRGELTRLVLAHDKRD
jgi:DNA-binding CsgD family transcriptional regulator/tetratricopeptide (TPR) repeat protein